MEDEGHHRSTAPAVPLIHIFHVSAELDGQNLKDFNPSEWDADHKITSGYNIL